MKLQETDALYEDPYLHIDQALGHESGVIEFPHRQLYLTDLEASQAVLANKEGKVEEHSDFFFTKKGVFGPRPVQIEIARESIKFLNAYLDNCAPLLKEEISGLLTAVTDWPDTGNWLLYRHFKRALMTESTDIKLQGLIDQVVKRAVFSGARNRYSLLRRAWFRLRVGRALRQEFSRRKAQSQARPGDIIDIISQATHPGVDKDDLAEVFLSFLFAMSGSVGFVLGWSFYLLGTHPKQQDLNHPPSWVVKEALRLWPVAWNSARKPSCEHTVAGRRVGPEDTLVSCPYAVQRNPEYWAEPDKFLPLRWAKPPKKPAFIPFGWGEHKCVAAALSMKLVEQILTLLHDYRIQVTHFSERPRADAALAPPRFSLSFTPKARSPVREAKDEISQIQGAEEEV